MLTMVLPQQRQNVIKWHEKKPLVGFSAQHKTMQEEYLMNFILKDCEQIEISFKMSFKV